jgi:exopolysaccharide biosynthesis polyprenyl glycosylphosphotransferase
MSKGVKMNVSYTKDSVILKPEEETMRIQIHYPAHATERTNKKEQKRLGYHFFKRAFDITASFFGMVILSPLFLVVAIAIRLESKGNPIFKQTRIGKDGKPFMFYKFRSMHKDAEYRRSELIELNERDGPVFKMTNDPRVTKVGKFIRKTSIDELPQLLNILKGDMTFVGPRPPLPNEVEQYSDFHFRRLEVKGGLTCYWQIKGRGEVILFNDWVNMDIKYIEERSLWVDFKILMKTFKIVFFGKGAY